MEGVKRKWKILVEAQLDFFTWEAIGRYVGVNGITLRGWVRDSKGNMPPQLANILKKWNPAELKRDMRESQMMRRNAIKKTQFIERAVKKGISFREVAYDVGVDASSLRSWVKSDTLSMRAVNVLYNWNSAYLSGKVKEKEAAFRIAVRKLKMIKKTAKIHPDKVHSRKRLVYPTVL